VQLRRTKGWHIPPNTVKVDLVNRAEIGGASVAERKRLVKALIKQRAQLMPRIPVATERGEGAAA
jgi:hypothetical protein